MIDELDATLRKPKFDTRFQEKGVTVDDLMDGYRQMTQLVIPAEIPDDSVRDPKDRIILAAALGGSVSHLISGDKDLTSLQQYHEVIILTVAQFLALLTTPTNLHWMNLAQNNCALNLTGRRKLDPAPCSSK